MPPLDLSKSDGLRLTMGIGQMNSEQETDECDASSFQVWYEFYASKQGIADKERDGKLWSLITHKS